MSPAVVLRTFAPVLLAALVVLPASTASAETVDFAFQPALQQADPTSVPLMDITRAGERLVVVGEYGVIAISDDDGASWQQANVPVSTTLTAVDFPDAESGWATGHGGVILHSTDGGLNWALQFDGSKASQQYLAFMEQRVDKLEQAAAAEADPDLAAELSYTLEDAEFALEDAQAAIDAGPADPFLDILMLDTRHGFAVGAYGMLYRTADGGNNWQLDIGNITNPDRYHYYALASAGGSNLVLAGEAGLLYHSNDSGGNWIQHEGVYDGSLFGAVNDGNSTLVFGLRGHVFRTDDRGKSWQQLSIDTEHGLYGGTKLQDGRTLLVGSGGQLLISNADGTSFSATNHASRSSFTRGISDGNGGLLLVGMDGLTRIAPGNFANE